MPAIRSIYSSTGRNRRKVVFGILAAAALLSTVELAARLLEIPFPPLTVDYGLGFNPDSRVFAPNASDPETLETVPSKRAVFLHQSFRRHRPPDTVRIFMLGESSVRRLNTELLLLQHELARAWKQHVEIINVGGNSYGSHRLVFVAAEVLGYEPSLILWHVGNNEFEEVEQLHLASLSTLRIQSLLSRSAFVRLMRDGIAGFQVSRLKREHDRWVRCWRSWPDFGIAIQYPFTKQDVAERMKDFRANLENVIALCRSRQVPIVVGTVPSNLWRPRIGTADKNILKEIIRLQNEQYFFEALQRSRQWLVNTTYRHQSSDLENNIIREVARETQTPLADVEQAILQAEPHGIPGEKLFKDGCHLNDAGNQILIRVYRECMARVYSSAH